MMALFMALVIQSPSLDNRIESYLKGDAAAKAEIVKLGAFAIRPLQAARGKGAEKIDALVFEVKRAACYPKNSAGAERLLLEGELQTTDKPFEYAVSKIQEFCGVAVFTTPAEPGDLKSDKVTLKAGKRTAREMLDDACRQAGLDYGFFHNQVVLARPVRLWPEGPPSKPRELTPAESKRAKELVEALGDKALKIRKDAMESLHMMGPPVIAYLETQAKHGDPEIAARVGTVLTLLRPAPFVKYGPPGAELQHRTPEDDKVFGKLETSLLKISFQDQTAASAGGFIAAVTRTPIVFENGVGTQKIAVAARQQSALDILSLITQSHDLDFMIRDGKAVVDTREAIQKAISKGSK